MFDLILHGDRGLGRFPSRQFASAEVWLLLALTGDAKTVAPSEPKALHYRFVHPPS